MTKLNALERSIVKTLASDEFTQEALALKIGQPLRTVRDSLLRLQKSGVITLDRNGQRRSPRLTALRDLVDSVNRLEAAVLSLVEAVAA
jgi:predicted transcriptional regulator